MDNYLDLQIIENMSFVPPETQLNRKDLRDRPRLALRDTSTELICSNDLGERFMKENFGRKRFSRDIISISFVRREIRKEKL